MRQQLYAAGTGDGDGQLGGAVINSVDEALLVRSVSGIVPWYYTDLAAGFAASTSLNLLTQLRLASSRLDEVGIATMATGLGSAPTGRTTIKGVRLLARGEALRVTEKASRCSRYWDPRSAGRPSADTDMPVAFRGALIDRLDDDLRGARLNLISLSGGTDSSAIAYIAGRLLGARLATITLATDTSAAKQMLATRASVVWKDVGIHRRHVAPHGLRHALDLLETFAPPSAIPILHPVLLLLPTLAERWKPEVLVGGEFVDESLGTRLTAYDLLRPCSPQLPFRLGRQGYVNLRLRSWCKAQVQGTLRRPPLREPMRLPDIFAAQIREEYQQLRLDRRRELLAEGRGHLQLWDSLTTGAGWVEMNWEATSRLGIRRSIPFLDPRLLDIALTASTDQLLSQGPKTILRQALRDDVPAMFLDAPKRSESEGPVAPDAIPLPSTLDPATEELLIPDWRSWAHDHAQRRAMVRRVAASVRAAHALQTLGG